MPEDKMIEIPLSEYEELVADSKWLSALNSAGVDNWQGYSFAYDVYEDLYNEPRY